MPGILYLVATPIGNLGDISARCVETLNTVDFIAAEDTRVTVKLLNHLEIKKPTVSYYEHNSRESGRRIVERLLSGESCALVTDAGMPAISDPGEDIVALCRDSGVTVSVIPGPCAFISALALSGLPTGRFTFEGFLTTNTKNRREHLKQLEKETRTMVFYEAPHKLKKTLKDMLSAFGNRDIALCRELTKLHEQVLRLKLTEAVDYYEQMEPRGEFVLVIRGADAGAEEMMSLEDAAEVVRTLVESGSTVKDTVKKVAGEQGISKNELYNLVVSKML